MSEGFSIFSAKDMPDGTVIAVDNVIYVKTHSRYGHPWRSTEGGIYSNNFVDDMIIHDDAVMLRRGASLPKMCEECHSTALSLVMISISEMIEAKRKKED